MNCENEFYSLLIDACEVLVRLVTLIPPDRVDERRAACDLVLSEVAEQVDKLLGDANQAKH